MNPFDHPADSFDLEQLLDNDPKKVEILFRSFFQQLSHEESLEEILSCKSDDNDHVAKNSNKSGNNGSSPPKLRVYQIQRYLSPKESTLELIQAYNRSQACYLFLLYESRTPNTYPFYDRLKYCRNLGSLTPYDVYRLVIDSTFDADLIFNDYLFEIDHLTIINLVSK